LIDGWAGAPLLATLGALGGVAVGVIDAAHAPTRGRLVATGFGLVFVGASWLLWHQQRQHSWDRQVEASLRPAAIDDGSPSDVAVDEGAVRIVSPTRPAARPQR
jgi:hypothetical protein